MINRSLHVSTQSHDPLPIEILRLGVSRVTDYVFFGGGMDSRAYRKLNTLGVTVFVNLQAERQETFRNVHVDAYLWAPVADHMPPTLTQLGLIVDFIDRAVDRKRKVLVYCRAGVGRSTMACAAYLVRSGMEVDEAVTMLRQIRPIVQLSESQDARLREFAGMIDASKNRESETT